jgi:hypothetical protein
VRSHQLRRRPAIGPAASVIILLALIPAGPAAAQSPFALKNIGMDVSATDARMAGRGGWGMAEDDSLLVGFKNLASLPGTDAVMLLLCGFAESRTSESPDARRDTRRVMTPDLRVAAPAFSGRLVFTAGFKLRRTTEYKTLRPSTWISGVDTVEGRQQFVREGTLFDIPLGVAWQARPWLSLAASLNLVRGSTREILNDIFDEPLSSGGSPLYLTASRVQEDDYEGTSTTLAILLAPLSSWRVGASYVPAHEVEVQRGLDLEGVAAGADSTYTLDMPARWAVGAKVRLLNRWWAGGDYERRLYSEFGGRAKWASEMVDEWVASWGIEREGARARRGGWGNLPIRAGVSLHRWAYRVGGAEIHQTTVALGTGFPFRKGGGHLDVSLAHSWLGDLAENGLADRVWRVTVSVIGLEKWW